ncbi:unnamed protein product [Ectocarpus sp. 6 AP-2014]
MRLRVDIGKDPVSSRRLLVPVDGSSTVAELTRAVEDREHKRRKTTGEASIQIGEIQLRVQDGLCEVDPDDVLSDLVANDSQDAVFVAICSESGAGASGQEPGGGASKSRTPAEKMMAAAAVMNASVAEAIEAANAAAASIAASTTNTGGGGGGGQQQQESAVDVVSGGGSGGGAGGSSAGAANGFQTLPMSGTAGAGSVPHAPNGIPITYGAPPPAPAGGGGGSGGGGGGGGSSGGPRFQPPVRQWQAAEKLVLTAFQLQVSEPLVQQEEAKAFLTGLAKAAGEPAGPVIALVRAVVQPAPWGSGYLVASRRQLTNLCQSNGTPTGFDCLTRYLLGNRYPQPTGPASNSRVGPGSNRVDTPRVRKCFSALAAQVGNHPDRGQLDYHALGVGRCVFTLRRARVAALAASANAAKLGAAAARLAPPQPPPPPPPAVVAYHSNVPTRLSPRPAAVYINNAPAPPPAPPAGVDADGGGGAAEKDIDVVAEEVGGGGNGVRGAPQDVFPRRRTQFESF